MYEIKGELWFLFVLAVPGLLAWLRWSMTRLKTERSSEQINSSYWGCYEGTTGGTVSAIPFPKLLPEVEEHENWDTKHVPSWHP